MRRLFVALLLLASAASGCLDGSFVDRIRNDLQAEEEFEDRSLMNEEIEFTPLDVVDPQNPPEDPTSIGTQWNGSVQVPPGARSLTVSFEIDFTTPEPPGGLPAPSVENEVTVYVETADGEQRNLTRSEPATVGFDFSNPTAGEWTVGMTARGNGTVGFNVNAIVPVDA